MCSYWGKELGILFRKHELLGLAFLGGECAFPAGRTGVGGVVGAVSSNSYLRALLAGVLLAAVSMARDSTTMVRVPSVAAEFDILLEGGEMTRETMVRECEAILDREKDTPFLRIQFADSRAGLNSWRSMPDSRYVSQWVITKRQMNQRRVRYGEMVSIRGNAVLRIRDGFEIQTLVLRGTNPLRVSHEGRTVEFVHFGMVYNYTKTAVLIADLAAVVPRGELNAELAKSVTRAAHRVVRQSFPTNLTVAEDRFYSFYRREFVNSLLFDLDDPPAADAGAFARNAQCAMKQNGNGVCYVDGPANGKREVLYFSDRAGVEQPDPIGPCAAASADRSWDGKGIEGLGTWIIDSHSAYLSESSMAAGSKWCPIVLDLGGDSMLGSLTKTGNEGVLHPALIDAVHEYRAYLKVNPGRFRQVRMKGVLRIKDVFRLTEPGRGNGYGYRGLSRRVLLVESIDAVGQ